MIRRRSQTLSFAEARIASVAESEFIEDPVRPNHRREDGREHTARYTDPWE